ncbi:MAG: hypothetical protein ABJF50_21710 [Paracoccaceae bacterium]
MSDVTDELDPLTAAFANPKAGKKLKPGEVLPGMDRTSQPTSIVHDVPTVPDAALSHALDDAFSDPNFGSEKSAAPVLEPEYAEDMALIEAKRARDIDDAFANPKVGNKIEDGVSLTNSGIQSPGLGAESMESLHYNHPPVKSGGVSGPKALVIGMILLMIVGAVFVGGADTGSAPTILRLD